MNSDEHREGLAWLADILRCSTESLVSELIAGDASPRKFYRITTVDLQTHILMLSPATENNERFVLVQRLLESKAIPVPGLPRADMRRGYFLLEDLGDITFWQALENTPKAVEVDSLYHGALSVLASLQVIRSADHVLPRYDYTELKRELDVCPDWFFSKVLRLDLDKQAVALFGAFSDRLIDAAHAQPQVLVHRDYHSRNLMMRSGSLTPALIDFQDAIIGPVCYDAASLLKDVYVVWPRGRQLEWLAHYWRLLTETGQLPSDSWAQFIQWFDLIGLQRHVKILGVFSRLWLRDDKPGYMRDIPVVIGYIREACIEWGDDFPELLLFWDWFEKEVMPTASRQNWYAGS